MSGKGDIVESENLTSRVRKWRLRIVALLTGICAAGIQLSCAPGTFELLSRTGSDPEIAKPYVVSLAEAGEVLITWDADLATDSYRLYRSTDPDSAGSLCVYSGGCLSFADRTVDLDRMYYYALSKVRGQKEFGQSEAVPGVASAIRRDPFDNDRRENATEHTYVTPASIFYYRDSYGTEIEDTDWYYINIGPRTFVTLSVRFLANVTPRELWFMVDGQLPSLLSENAEPVLFNYETVPRRICFRISVNKENYLGIAAAAGGKSASYEVIYLQSNAIS